MFPNGSRKGKIPNRIADTVTCSAEETQAWGSSFAKELPPGSVVCLFGDLGAGKTTLIKGIAHAAANYPEEEVRSPTFTYLHIYEGPLVVYHFDLYRLACADEFLAMGFEEYFSQQGICCLEWSERIAEILPKPRWEVRLFHLEGEKRRLKVQKIEGL